MDPVVERARDQPCTCVSGSRLRPSVPPLRPDVQGSVVPPSLKSPLMRMLVMTGSADEVVDEAAWVVDVASVVLSVEMVMIVEEDSTVEDADSVDVGAVVLSVEIVTIVEDVSTVDDADSVVVAIVVLSVETVPEEDVSTVEDEATSTLVLDLGLHSAASEPATKLKAANAANNFCETIAKD